MSTVLMFIKKCLKIFEEPILISSIILSNQLSTYLFLRGDSYSGIGGAASLRYKNRKSISVKLVEKIISIPVIFKKSE